MIGWNRVCPKRDLGWKRGEDGLCLASSSPPSLTLKTPRHVRTRRLRPGNRGSPIPAKGYANARMPE
jgi:hypothetical protein